jgi:vitamin B12 transporter
MFSLQRTRALVAPCVLGVAVFALAALPARAQAAPVPNPTSTPPAEIGRIFTSDRQPEAAGKTTHPTFVVDRAAIENFGSRTIGDALSNVPGFSLFSFGAFGAQNNYGIRGTTSAETLVLQDGVPITSGSNGVVDLGSLSTAGVERIEVVESGSSTLYGSGATGGVINIITAVAAQPYLRVADGTYGDRDLALQAGSGNLALSYERHLASNVFDYPAFNYAGGNATPAGTRTNDDAQQTVFRVSYFAQLGGGWTARLAAGENTIKIGVPGNLSFLTPFARQDTSRTDALIDFSHVLGKGTIDLTLSGVGQKLAFRDTLADLVFPPMVPVGTGIDETVTYDGRSQAALRYTTSGKSGSIVAGIDLARETALLTFPASVPAQPAVGVAESQAAAYVQAGYDLSSNVRFVAGLRGENDAPRGGVLAPAFGTRVAFGPARLTANVSESFRVPTLIDLYFPGFSNPTLLPEKLTNYDATLAFPNLAGGVSIGYFGRNGSNLIVLNPNTFAPFNASRVSVNGVQLTLATRPLNHLRVSASLTDLYRALDTSTGVRLPSTPPIIGTLAIERPFDGGTLAFGARIRIVGSSPDVPNFGGGPSLSDPYDAYTVADLYARYRVRPNAILTVRSNNVGNERYAPIFGYPAPGRTVTVELSTR